MGYTRRSCWSLALVRGAVGACLMLGAYSCGPSKKELTSGLAEAEREIEALEAAVENAQVALQKQRELVASKEPSWRDKEKEFAAREARLKELEDEIYQRELELSGVEAERRKWLEQDKGRFGGSFEDGVLTLDFGEIDDLLKLRDAEALRIVEITSRSEQIVSSAHLELLLRWIEAGGIAWFHSDGYETSLFAKVSPEVTVDWAYVEKESGAGYYCLPQDCTGELIVKGLLPHLEIAEHSITRDVETLFVMPNFARFHKTLEIHPKPGWSYRDMAISEEIKKATEDHGYSIDYVRVERGQPMKPVISFTSDAKGLHLVGPGHKPRSLGEKMALLGLIERGRGLIILDMTQLGRKRWSGPAGDSYDAPNFYANIKGYSLAAN